MQVSFLNFFMMTTTTSPAPPALHPIALALLSARASGIPWTPDLTQALSEDDAYLVQDQVAAALGWFADHLPRAWKAGAPDRLARPTAAPLPTPLPGTAEAPALWSATGHHALSIEAELAFRLGRTPAHPEEVLDCIDSVCVSIEMVATRISGGLHLPNAWKLADQQVNAGLILGSETKFQARDWQQQRVALEINGRSHLTVQGGHPCEDPLFAIPWLAAHALHRGMPLREGDMITTGSWTGITPVQAGDRIIVRFDDIGDSAVTILP